jgi:hypothetical protein
MALFADGLCATLQEMAMYDSSVLNVASTEGIDLTAKLTLTQNSLASELALLLAGSRIESVVVTGPLKTFYIYNALEEVYRDAYNSQLNDRYEGRWRQYERLRREAWQRLLDTGVGLVEDPLPKLRELLLGATAGNGESGALFVRAAWVNKRGEEGAASECGSWIVDPGQSVTAKPGAAPPAAVGWNVYAGWTPEALLRQNEEPIPTDATWIQPTELATDGNGPGTGQAASFVRALPRILRRG